MKKITISDHTYKMLETWAKGFGTTGNDMFRLMDNVADNIIKDGLVYRGVKDTSNKA